MSVEMISVKSSNLAAVGYDRDYQEMHIHFSTGGQYIYEDVPPGTFADMMEAPSTGRFFMQHIRGKFTDRKA